jgi:hypothetical protein
MAEADGSDPQRTRLYVAGVLLAGLAIAVVVVVIAGGGGETEVTDADPQCIEDWNGDQTMVSFGQHQFNGHGYERVQVLRVTDAGEPTDSGEGLCAVVFAARALDPEPGARGQVLIDGKWTGFEALDDVDEEEIAQLQSEAFAAANATLTTAGTLQETAS